jgi:hypothetical protein
MVMSSPTARTMALLRREGYVAAACEAWLPAVRRRRDLFGFADVAAVHPHVPGPLLVQTTSAANLSSRRRKVCGSAAARLWLRCGARIELHGWEKTPAGRWRCRRQAVRAADLTAVDLTPPPAPRPARGPDRAVPRRRRAAAGRECSRLRVVGAGGRGPAGFLRVRPWSARRNCSG